MIEYKLQNVLLENNTRTRLYEGMYVRTTTPLIFNEDDSILMPKHSKYLLNTYFGGLSASKWYEYASVDNFKLHIKFEGSIEVALMKFENDMDYNLAKRTELGIQRFESDKPTEISMEYPIDDIEKTHMLAFEIITLEDTTFYGAWYTTDIEEDRLRDVELNIVTPTFKKEEFVRNNVKLYEKLFESDEPIADHLTVSIIDNGQTLEDDLSTSPRIKKYKNPNYGGAGGFARGMIEALHADSKPTHLMMMDDDVQISAESFIRTYNLLRIVNDEYKDAFISGAMLMLQHPEHQIEDVGHVHDDATFHAVKGWHHFLGDLNHVVSNETIVYNRHRQYAAFWYCCFPMSVVEEQGLTMPFFVRCDDIEYNLRVPDRKFMTMNGICVWHMSFGRSKFNAFNEAYLAIRNLLVLKAIVPECKDIDVIGNLFHRDIETELRKFNYGIADMMCDAVDDYLKGPEWLATTNPEQILRTESQKKPKQMTYEGKLPSSATFLYESGPLRFKDRLIMKLTHNGQKFWKDDKMKDEPGTAMYEFRCYHGDRYYMHKELWFINDDRCTGFKTHIDRKRYNELETRIKDLDRRLERDGEVVAQKWRDAYDYLVSEDFWLDFLGLDREQYK